MVERNTFPTPNPNEQQENPPLTLETVVGIARQVTLQNGRHAPTLMVEGQRHTAIIQLARIADSFDARAAQMARIGWLLAHSDEVGSLRQVFFITEAWMSTVKDGELPDTRPSQDPDRLEVLTVSGLSVETGQTQMALYEMQRDGHGQLQTLRDLNEQLASPNSRAESPLLNAFVLGFLGDSPPLAD